MCVNGAHTDAGGRLPIFQCHFRLILQEADTQMESGARGKSRFRMLELRGSRIGLRENLGWKGRRSNGNSGARIAWEEQADDVNLRGGHSLFVRICLLCFYLLM